MRRVLLGVLASLVLVSTARAEDPRTYPYDVSARVLPADRLEVDSAWLRLGKTVAPGLQLTTHAAAWPVLLPNLYAKWTFVDTPAFAAALDGGVLWAALAHVVLPKDGAMFVAIPLALRTTAALAPDLDLNVAWRFEAQLGALAGLRTGSNSFRSELSLVRTDAGGAWLLEATLPIFVQQATGAESLLGKADVLGFATLDTLPAWSVVLTRDFSIPVRWFSPDDDFHVRLGAGYRHRPGIVFLESFGHVVVVFDLYVRTRWGEPAPKERPAN